MTSELVLQTKISIIVNCCFSFRRRRRRPFQFRRKSSERVEPANPKSPQQSPLKRKFIIQLTKMNLSTLDNV